MIAAAVQKSAWSLDKLTFGWFDVALVLILAFGFWRGRKRGMSRELLPLLKWLAIVIAGALGYRLLGDELTQSGYIQKIYGTKFLASTAGNVTAYLIIAGFVWAAFAIINNLFKKKVETANAFGGGEYYLGVISGVVRYACIVFFLLALLSAPFYTVEEIAARAAYNKQWFGGGLYDGNYLGDVPSLQNSVFKKSILGPLIHDHCSALLIEQMAAGGKKPVKH
jgi:uncharacterized membrane protein required for colicin V production